MSESSESVLGREALQPVESRAELVSKLNEITAQMTRIRHIMDSQREQNNAPFESQMSDLQAQYDTVQARLDSAPEL